jgi:hypothetical protein
MARATTSPFANLSVEQLRNIGERAVRQHLVWFSVVIAIACSAMGLSPAVAAVKVIGDFEGNLESPYPGNGWSTDTGITAPVEFISVNDPDYRGGVTLGEQALLLTTPSLWNGPDFFRLNGGEQMMADMATFPYLLFDVTTYGDPETPEEGPTWRQVFNIFNNTVTGWYDSNNDNDIQRDFPIPGFADESLTTTVVVDMNGPDPAVNDDEMNFFHLRAQEALTDHTDGTPIENFYWEILWAFQGGNVPESSEIQIIVDNVRLCDTLDCVPSPTLEGDFNQNGSVDAADYVVWREGLGTTHTPDDYGVWRAHFGQTGGSGAVLAAAAVPELGSVGLAMIAAVCIAICGCRRKVNLPLIS